MSIDTYRITAYIPRPGAATLPDIRSVEVRAIKPANALYHAIAMPQLGIADHAIGFDETIEIRIDRTR